MMYSGDIWLTWLSRIPVLLVLLAGIVIALFAFLDRRRRTASCLGAVGFAVLLFVNVLVLLLPLLPRRWVLGRAGVAAGAQGVGGIASVCLGLVDAVAIGLLIAAVVIRERRNGETR